ncbi:MAG: hypothetical protein AAFQ87_16250 [Bacteroidota bacterium]
MLTSQAVKYQIDRLDQRIDRLPPPDSSSLTDADQDTRISLEAQNDEDHIRFITQNQERLVLDDSGRIEMQGKWSLNGGPAIVNVRQDNTLIASDSTLATEGSIKTYVDQQIASLPEPKSAGPYLLLSDYGIVGDSTTDYTDTLNALILRFPEATLFFPDGVYRANIDIQTPITLLSTSGNVEIRSANSGTPVLSVSAPCTLKGIQFIHESQDAGSDGLRNLGFDIWASDCRFVGYEHDATHHQTTSHFERCTFTITAVSLGTLAWSPNARFYETTFDGEYGADVQDSKFYDCRFYGRWGVHMPDGAVDNQGNPTGFAGIAEFHNCELVGTENYAIGLGNRARAIMYNCRLTGYDAGAYARTESTYEMYNCYVACVRGAGTASALFFSKYIKDDKAAIGLIDTGDSYFAHTTFLNLGSSSGLHIVVPNKSSAGKAVFSECNFDISKVCTEDTLAFCQGDIYNYLQFEGGQLDAADQSVQLENNEFLSPAITSTREAYLDIQGATGPVSGIMLDKLDQHGQEYPIGFRVILRCGSATQNVTLRNAYNASKGVGLFTASGKNLTLDQNEVAIFTYTRSLWIQTSPNGAVFADAAGSVQLQGALNLQQGISINEFSNDGRMIGNSDAAVPTERAVRTYIDNRAQLLAHENISGNSALSFVIPAGFRLVSMVCEENTGQAAGNIRIGTSSNGDEVVNDISMSANQLEAYSLKKQVFSLISNQTLYISSDNWGGANVSVYARVERIK